MYQVIRNTLLAAHIADPRTEAIVVGAWGAGKFYNNAEFSLRLIHEVIVKEGIDMLYKEIHFAVPNLSTDTYKTPETRRHLSKTTTWC